MGPSFLAGTPPANFKMNRLCFTRQRCNVCSDATPGFLTIHTRVVVVDGFDHAAKVQLHVLLNQPGVKGAEVAVLVIYAEGRNSS